MRSSTFVLVFLSPFGVTAQNKLVSKDGTCSGSKSYTCLGSAWGDCCSQYGWCGSTPAYCGSGCDSNFGTCDGPSVPSASSIKASSPSRATSPSAPTGTQRVSSDARCGPSFGDTTCLGSKWGDCCSQHFYCGSTNDYCGSNTCQKEFGKCNTADSSSTTLQSSIRSSSRVQSSTTSRASSSSATKAPSSSSSTAPQPTNCVSVPACESFTGSPARSACSDTNNKCSSGYQVKCGLQPAQDSSIVLTSGPQQPDDAGVACAASCTSDAACVGFTYTQRISAARWICTTYSKITLETNTFSGRTQLKVCPN